MSGNAKSFVFVSHQAEDRDRSRAGCASAWTNDFLGMAPVFVSSDGEGIRAGEQWFDVIRQRINECRCVLILCTGESVIQPWVNFEFGAAWALGKVVIPVCHSGYLPADLGMPFSQSQGVALPTRGWRQSALPGGRRSARQPRPGGRLRSARRDGAKVERLAPLELERRADENTVRRIREALETRPAMADGETRRRRGRACRKRRRCRSCAPTTRSYSATAPRAVCSSGWGRADRRGRSRGRTVQSGR